MPVPDLKQVKAIFADALELTGGARETFLDEACGNDPTLRREVTAYLDATERAGDALDSPRQTRHFTPMPPSAPAAPQQAVGSIIGNYQLEELIGQGGFGAVYRAEQQRPVRRDVALKIIKLGMDTQQVIARFEAERQALAMMDHPNIARVFEAGATETGRPYFVMELVRGVPITEYCDAHALTTAQRLQLFMTVCDAIQHAHHKGVIHRDIKPSNVLVTIAGAGGSAVAKVIDFGISKATDHRLTGQTTFTAAQHRVGTPAYMSPEQTGIGHLDIDTRSDIYSLGVLLYELLTGTTPLGPQQLHSSDYGQAQRIIAEVDPPRPSSRLGAMGEGLDQVAASRGQRPQKLRQSIRGELDWIVMKALEKDRDRRYQSAHELARDIGRHLSNEPIEAGPPSVVYRMRKFVHRHRAAAVTSAAFAILLLAAVVIYLHGVGAERRNTEAALQESQRQRRDADRRREEAQQASVRALAAEAQANQELVLAALTQGHGAQVSTRPGRRYDSLKLLAAAARISPTTAVRSQAIACLGLADLRITQEWSGPDHAVCFNHACTFYADSTPDGEVLIRPVPVADGRSPASAPAIRLPGRIWKNPGVSEDGGQVVFSSDDRLVAVSHADGHVRVFRLDGQVVRDIDQATACDFSPDGATLAVCQRFGVVQIIDLKSGKEKKRLYWPGSNSILFSPDGRKLALWNQSDSTDLVVGDIQSAKYTLVSNESRISRVCWHPNGNMLATAGEDRRVFLWDVADVERPSRFNGWGAHFAAVTAVEFNHGGNLLATASLDGTVRLWDVSSIEQLVRVYCTGVLRFSPDDRTLAVAGYDGRHALFEVAAGGERRSLGIGAGNRECVAFSPDGALLACDCGVVMRFWNLTGSIATPYFSELNFLKETRSVAFHPDGGSVFISTDAGLWRVPIETQLRDDSAPHAPALNRSAPARQVTMGPVADPLVSQIGNSVGTVQVSRDGHFVAWAQWGRGAAIVNLEHPHEPRFLPDSADCRCISISPDGKWVATGSLKGAGDERVRIWDSRTARLVRSLPIALDAIVAFSPDGGWLVTATPNEICFWDPGTWRPRRILAMENDLSGQICFSPDSQMVAMASQHMGVRLLDVNTGVELATLEDEGDQRPLGFSPDGGLLVTRGRFASIRLWDLRRIRAELGEMGLDWSNPPIPPAQPKPFIDLAVKTAPTTLPAP